MRNQDVHRLAVGVEGTTRDGLPGGPLIWDGLNPAGKPDPQSGTLYDPEVVNVVDDSYRIHRHQIDARIGRGEGIKPVVILVVAAGKPD